MKVSNITGNYERQALVNEQAESQRAGNNEQMKQEQKTTATPNDVIVDLSDVSKEMQIAKQAMAADEENSLERAEKVDKVANAMKNGSYDVNPEQVAEKMIGTIISKIV